MESNTKYFPQCLELEESPYDEINQECNQIFPTLTKAKGWTSTISDYQDFWCPSRYFATIVAFQRHFHARDSDVISASYPKSGTTWLKALLFAIVNRSNSASSSPLLKSNPHDLVPFLELKLYVGNKIPELDSLPSPRLLATHLPFQSLCPSIIETPKCKIVYVCRNPLNVFVSLWHFFKDNTEESSLPFTLEEYFESFCRGQTLFGSWWDHVLRYWHKSLEMPDKVLFLKYEDMKKDIKLHIKKLAEFIGSPITPEEEKDGAIDHISDICSFKKLKELDANKYGEFVPLFEIKSLFRKGEVGGWEDTLTPTMVERLDKCMKEKLMGSGLTFQVQSNK